MSCVEFPFEENSVIVDENCGLCCCLVGKPKRLQSEKLLLEYFVHGRSLGFLDWVLLVWSFVQSWEQNWQQKHQWMALKETEAQLLQTSLSLGQLTLGVVPILVQFVLTNGYWRS